MSSERLSQIYKRPNDPDWVKIETAKSRAQRRSLGEDEFTFQPRVNASSEVLAKDWIAQPLEHRLYYAERVKQEQKEKVWIHNFMFNVVFSSYRQHAFIFHEILLFSNLPSVVISHEILSFIFCSNSNSKRCSVRWRNVLSNQS